MIVACPACQTQFELDSGLIGPAGRNVRCGTCEHRWRQMPDSQEPIAPSAVATEEPATDSKVSDPAPVRPPTERLIPIRDLPRDAEPAPARSRAGLALVLVAGLVVGLLAGAYVLRETVMRLWPASEALYALLHLVAPDPLAMLELANLKNEERTDEGKKLMDVSGVIFNPSEQPIDLPPLMIIFTDSAGQAIEPVNVFHIKEPAIEAGQNIAFKAEKIEMPEGAKSFRVSFGKIK